MSNRTRRIMLIAGEPSGDRIASRTIRAARRIAKEHDINLEIFGIAGDECIAEGVESIHTCSAMSVVGFVEVARRFRFFRDVLREMTALLDKRRPDVLLLIDYPGFNIRLAREAKKRGIRVVYYVSPQVWAWHASRIQELKEVVDEMLVIFPFEEKLYRDAGLTNAHFIGHPVVERIDEERHLFRNRESFAKVFGLDVSKEWLLVMPGSRTDEVRRLLPAMSIAAKDFADRHAMQAVLVESSSIESSHYSHYLQSPLTRFRDSIATHELMSHAKLGILKSGTTTLEAALLGLPGAICYRTHPATFFIGKRVVRLPYIGLANIVLGHKLYPELLQNDVTPSAIAKELEEVMDRYSAFKSSLDGLANKLRVSGAGPSERVAQSLLA
jgi:lipid-A-disaccharide synthase